MLIGARLTELRNRKGLSQGDIERATGLPRCYISRVEHGHVMPSLENLEKFARGLGMPLFQVFCINEEALSDTGLNTDALLSKGTEPELQKIQFLSKLNHLCSQIHERDRQFLLAFAKLLGTRAESRRRA